MRNFDTIVCGLGAMGSAAVYQLAKRRNKVLGLERFSLPHANGSSHGESRIIRQAIGEGEDYVPLVLRSYQLWREIETETGLAISIKTPVTRAAPGAFLPYKLTASCMDHPGIVYQISAVLSCVGINIESMETKTYAAPISGTPIFQLEAEIAVPARTNINQLRARFAEIQREENIDIDLAAAKS